MAGFILVSNTGIRLPLGGMGNDLDAPRTGAEAAQFDSDSIIGSPRSGNRGLFVPLE